MSNEKSAQGPTAVIVLAAGAGTRMKSATPKVLHRVLGMPLIEHVLFAATPAGASDVVVVVGHGRDQVTAQLEKTYPNVKTVVQEQQNGTGHAVSIALSELTHVASGSVVVLAGDTPLLTSEDIIGLSQAQEGSAASILTAHIEDPSGYGRIVRNSDGDVVAIVEHRDATDEQRQITEVNSGVYCFDVALLRDALQRVGTANDQGEQYLTDVIGILRNDGHIVKALVTKEENILGVNDRRQLAEAAYILRDRIVNQWMLDGVTIVDPATTWIDRAVVLSPDVQILQNVALEGTTQVGSGSVIGPDCTLTNTVVGENASVIRTTAKDAVIGTKATVGPYTYLRPGTVLGEGAKAGGFVEMKNAQLGNGAKVPHLSYVGDATIGEGTNLGAATVIVNYDGVEKHHTTIGKHARIGSDSMIVAPVTIGDGAYTAAGSVITEDVPPGAIAVARARQRNILDWVLRRRPGSDSAKAAMADSTSTDTSS